MEEDPWSSSLGLFLTLSPSHLDLKEPWRVYEHAGGGDGEDVEAKLAEPETRKDEDEMGWDWEVDEGASRNSMRLEQVCVNRC